MPRTAFTPVTASSAYSTTGYLATPVACDSANGNEFTAADGIMLVIVVNPTGSAQTLTITSQPDPVNGRTGDVNVSVLANTTRVIRLTKSGWSDSLGKINLNGHATLTVSIIFL